MFRIALISLIIINIPLFSCKNPNNSSANSVTEAPPRDSILAEPDASDLLQALQGKWQSEQDSTYLIEIVGNKMRHYTSGKMNGESEIEIDGNCLTTACKVDSIETDNGWCFVEKGQLDAQCNLVLKCDKKALQYRVLGAANPTQIFTKQ